MNSPRSARTDAAADATATGPRDRRSRGCGRTNRRGRHVATTPATRRAFSPALLSILYVLNQEHAERRVMLQQLRRIDAVIVAASGHRPANFIVLAPRFDAEDIADIRQ